jgi:hypothetical protein
MATTTIIVGGTMAGMIAGWELAPLKLELQALHLTTLCGVGGALFALSASCFAVEFAEARAANQRFLSQLAKLNLQLTRSIHAQREQRHRHRPPATAD